MVIQPTFLDSRRLGLEPDDPRQPDIWRFRVADVKRILDELDTFEAGVPWLHGRLDRARIVTETSDESPRRVAAVQRLTWARLRSALDPQDRAWSAAVTDFEADPLRQGLLTAKGMLP